MQSNFPEITAQSYLLYDRILNKIICTKDELKCREIASNTKIITIQTALRLWQSFGLDIYNSYFEVSAASQYQDGTSAGLKQGMQIKAYDSLFAMFLPSGNDAAYVIAENTGAILLKIKLGEQVLIDGVKRYNFLEQSLEFQKQSYKEFINEMNYTCKILGMTRSHFENPNGLNNPKQQSCCVDLNIICNQIIGSSLIKEVISSLYHSCQVLFRGQKITIGWENTNKLLRVEGFHGIKTGITPNAGSTICGWYRKDDLDLIVILLKCADPDQRFIESYNLVKWYQEERKKIVQNINIQTPQAREDQDNIDQQIRKDLTQKIQGKILDNLNKIKSKSFLLIDKKFEKIIFSQNVFKNLNNEFLDPFIFYMTVRRLLGNTQVNPQTTAFFVSEFALNQNKSQTNLIVGMQINIQDLLLGLILTYGYDIAYCLAVNSGALIYTLQINDHINTSFMHEQLDYKFTEEELNIGLNIFIQEINLTAQILGLKDTLCKIQDVDKKIVYKSSPYDLLQTFNTTIQDPFINYTLKLESHQCVGFLQDVEVPIIWKNQNIFYEDNRYTWLYNLNCKYQICLYRTLEDNFLIYLSGLNDYQLGFQDIKDLIIVYQQSMMTGHFDKMIVNSEQQIDWKDLQQTLLKKEIDFLKDQARIVFEKVKGTQKELKYQDFLNLLIQGLIAEKCPAQIN